jgi:hypothetical protein
MAFCRLGPVPPTPLVPWHHAHCDSKIRLPAAISLAPAVRSDGADAAPGGCAYTKRVSTRTAQTTPDIRLMRRIIGDW